MKNIIWKELRENFRWAGLGFFCLLLAEIFTLWSSHRHIAASLYANFTLCDIGFLDVSALGCSAIGAALGALQFLPELRRDQWASLLHRPVPRLVILLGKVAAGLVLYGLATGLPLLVSALYVALPGLFAAPFVPGIAIPAASDLLLGTVFYFTAILLALHPGRWFGSRGAIALSAVAVLALHLSGACPFALPLGAALVLFVAACGAMLGSIAARARIHRLALGLVIFTGIDTGLLFLAAPLRPSAPKIFENDTMSGFDIAHDGAVTFFQQFGDHEVVRTDEQGNVLPVERSSDHAPPPNDLYPIPFATSQSAKARGFMNRPRSSQDYLVLVAGGYGGPELWYLIAGRRSYFVGYDTLSARCVGICDSEGFKSSGATLRPFAGEPQLQPMQIAPTLFWVGSRGFAVDFAERRLQTLLDAKGDTIHGVLRFPSSSAHPRIAIALTSAIRIFDLNGAPIATLPIRHDPNLWPDIAITATDSFTRTFLEYDPASSTVRNSRDDVIYLDVIDAQGQRVAAYSKPQISVVPTLTWKDRIADLPITPFPALAAVYFVHRDYLNEMPGEYGARILPDWDCREFYALSGLTVILSLTAWFWGRRSGLSTNRIFLWVTLTILLNLAGFLAYRLSTHWPALVRCPRCAQRRPVTASTCPHCHTAWEPLPLNGAEIFDAA